MKSKKNLIMCIIAGIISCSYTLTAGAGSFSDTNILKSGLLISDDGNSSVNLLDYNTNNDNVVNVLDLCRAKRDLMEKYQVTSQYVTIEAAGPWISADNRSLTVPVKIKGNSLGVSNISFDIKYNDWYFTLADVYASSRGSVSFSKESGNVHYTAPGGVNLTSEGIFVYLVFSTADYVPDAMYNVRLNNIHAAMLENGSARELTAEECSSSAKLSFTYGNEKDNPFTEPALDEPDITEPPAETTPVTTVVTTVSEKVTKPPKQDELYFSLNNAEISSDGRHLKIPVYMDMNSRGLGSFSTVVKYDRSKFKLASVERGDFDGYGYVGGNSDNAVFSMNNGQNISQRSGIIAWLDFEINGNPDSKEYSFELTDINASYYENWNQKKVDRYQNKSEIYRFSFDGTAPSVTEVTEETTVTTTAAPEETTEPVPETSENPGHADPSVNAENIELEGLEMIQQWRRELNLPEFVPNQILFECADIRISDLKQSYSSTRPDGSTRKELLTQMNAPNAISSSEFHCRGFKSAESMLSQFKLTVAKVPGHSVESKDFSYIGIGYSDGYWCVILT